MLVGKKEAGTGRNLSFQAQYGDKVRKSCLICSGFIESFVKS
jgi:hypothetical protein